MTIATAPHPSGRSRPRTVVPALSGRRMDLDSLAASWQRALDSADRALVVAPGCLIASEVAVRRRDLVAERVRTAAALTGLAHDTGTRSPPWLSPVPVTNRMLGLAPTIHACLFDLDGVLTDSGLLHASAWALVFDSLLLHLSQGADRQFVRFDTGADYRAYIDGRPRLEGIHAFLASRGIRLPEGHPEDSTAELTAYGIARRKSEALARVESGRGTNALGTARRYLEAAGYAGLKRGVVSASASTLRMLELAGLGSLVEDTVDADVIRAERLRSRPAPDMLLAACFHLDVRPERAVTFTHSPEGVAAGHAAGMEVVGVGDSTRADLLRGFGAEHVVPSLGALLHHPIA